MRVEVERVTALRFDDGAPVRAASAIAPFGDGWLIAQDDATHAAWQRPDGIRPVRVAAAVDGHETFSSASGTKPLKPDFEAACPVPVDGRDGVLLLGSGSTPVRMRASLVTLGAAGPAYRMVDLTPVFHRVAAVLGLPPDRLNLEGACRLGDRLRWFQRGNAAAGVPSASADVDLAALLAVVTGTGHPDRVGVAGPRRYDLGTAAGVALAVTDAVALPDGRVLASGAAEDTPNAVDDGPVVGAALALLDGDRSVSVAALPATGGAVFKVEGLAVRRARAGEVSLLAVVDADDPETPSAQLLLRVTHD
ncbi:DUF6910 family protein [Jidongwangia harbinensis]|uniref:DUF6910 family protein n=1 Tax=Jidongwangia harbinensis TaxID=2878561 RepID=UPI001CD9A868|nr:hypothetical protein [Jidongwangia harbinensis]MCA2216245.1 hypothetical protein [Jidongwangia harbinensis]